MPLKFTLDFTVILNNGFFKQETPNIGIFFTRRASGNPAKGILRNGQISMRGSELPDPFQHRPSAEPARVNEQRTTQLRTELDRPLQMILDVLLPAGKFLRQLQDFDARSLIESIPHFHDTPLYLERFRQALSE